jgi:hypothetical protein
MPNTVFTSVWLVFSGPLSSVVDRLAFSGNGPNIFLVQLPIEKGRKNWTGGSGFVITPARDTNQEGAMQGRKTAIHIEMDDQTRATLVGWLRRQKTPVGLAKRARAMLLLADGHSFAATARQVELRERHVRKWALRFIAYGIDGLYDKKRPGRQPVFSPGGGVVRRQTGL